MNDAAGVGPVLEAGEMADAIIAAIRAENPDARVAERGAYVRVTVPGRCVVTRAAIERALGRPFVLPGDLERIMPSFSGKMRLSESAAEWTRPSARGG